VAAPPQIEVRVPRVFCGADGSFGNPLGVVLDGPSVAVDDRQALAAHLGYSETVFVDDASAGRIAIYTPEVEYPFAGHPTVGTAWLLREERMPVDVLRPPAGDVPVRYDGDLTWVAARVEWCPAFDLIELAGPEEIDEHPGIEEGDIYVWAWIDEAAGLIRARCFAPDAGIAEDEATGSSVLRLAAELDREIEVRQGEGSIIHACPLADGMVEIGGRVVDDG
jgi:predicted PhzF superfamily epimerase YddE/YHI9